MVGISFFSTLKNSTSNTYFQGEADLLHLRKYSAGNDPGILKNVLHGEEMILRLEEVRELDTAVEKPQRPFHKRV